jgi:hypothetical protein
MDADPIADHAALVELVRFEGGREPARVAQRVNRWFDERGADWVRAVLDAELGSHQPHHEAYRMLTVERRAALVAAAADRCRAEDRRGLQAGAFMLGRFISAPQPVAFWNGLDELQVAFVLDEWVRYLAYLALLDEVGARKLRLARQRIELDRVAVALGPGAEAETVKAVALLSEPYGTFFDYGAPWSLAQLRQICEEAGLPLPAADMS